jgi:hypothetical protein
VPSLPYAAKAVISPLPQLQAMPHDIEDAMEAFATLGRRPFLPDGRLSSALKLSCQRQQTALVGLLRIQKIWKGKG